MIATMRPKSPMASAKMRIRIMPTNSFGSMAFIRTPMSPTTPMAKPDAYPVMRWKVLTTPEKPQHRPEARCL